MIRPQISVRIGFCALALCAAAGQASADASALGLLYPFDSNNTAGWSNPMARNDDSSSAQINLPFTFCFYETDRTSLFVNNNGNISFGTPYSTFTPAGFPNAAFTMIAPFWADVDTRNTNLAGNPTNQVWVRSFDTPASAPGDDVFVVTWDAVGYYEVASAGNPTGGNNSLRNTFQVAIAADPNQWGLGLNCAFSYGDMNWTTGNASGGVGGFGGSPAVVGINNGDGIRYDQFGQFDDNGFDYLGGGPSPIGAGGVNYLDNFDVFFNACEGVVPAPSSAGALALGGLLLARRRRAN